jgi:hypothetical protein
LLEGIFSSLEQADILGSLIRPKEYLDHAITELQRPHTIRMDFDPEEAEIRHTITELANRDPLGLRQMLLNRVTDSFKVEASNTDDVGAALFGWEAEQGVRMLQLLDNRYTLVITNPPYLRSRDMDGLLRRYIEKHYPTGKRDLFATFILRCLELCRPNGRVAMLTMQSWMFLRSFTELRAISEEKLQETRNREIFTGLLRETRIESLAHLGEFAFEDAAGAFVAMFVIANRKPSSEHRMVAFRLVGLKSVSEKIQILQEAQQIKGDKNRYNPLQTDLLSIPETPLVYWLRPRFFALLKQSQCLQDLASIRQGLAPSDNERFTRFFWEVQSLGRVKDGIPQSGRWFYYAKGGRYQRWAGLIWLCLDWEYNGGRLKAFPKSVLRSPEFYFRKGYLVLDHMSKQAMPSYLLSFSSDCEISTAI